MKLSNLDTLDDCLPQKGMTNASAVHRRDWQAFLSDPNGVLAAFREQVGGRDRPEPEYGR